MFSRRFFIKGGLGSSLLMWLLGCRQAEQEIDARDPFPTLPYIQDVHSTGAKIIWESAGEHTGFVEVFQENTEISIFGDELEASKLHKVNISDLEPNQQYFYQVKEGHSRVGPVRSFKTALGRNEEGEFSFVVTGDSGTGEKAQTQLAEYMALKVPDFMLHTGDVVYEGYIREYQSKFFDPYRAIIHRAPVYPTVGDHDWDPEEDGEHAKAFYQFFSLPGKDSSSRTAVYSFIYGNALFVSLDSTIISKGEGSIDTQVEFLETTLKANEDIPWKFVYFHKPIFTNGEGRDGFEDLRSRLVDLANTYDITMTFSGDTHAYERFRVEGTHYVTTGGGGADLRSLEDKIEAEAKAETHHYVHVKINGKQLEYHVYDADNQPIDTVILEK